jgi:hypothetical protein
MNRGPLHILLTGAASGLGRGLALYFAARGHRLVLADRNLDGLRETVGLLGDAAGRASAHPLDVTSADQVRGLIAWPRSQRSPAEVRPRPGHRRLRSLIGLLPWQKGGPVPPGATGTAQPLPAAFSGSSASASHTSGTSRSPMRVRRMSPAAKPHSLWSTRPTTS